MPILMRLGCQHPLVQGKTISDFTISIVGTNKINIPRFVKGGKESYPGGVAG
jgi:hypothetical protein